MNLNKNHNYQKDPRDELIIIKILLMIILTHKIHPNNSIKNSKIMIK